ncbi:hypothetical protein COL154_013895 [Colletotrichum chrysophilum]|nr:hypothetical protein COL154_013895 [Colletotrichum chrysophilum]
MSGFGATASRLGTPDIGLLSQTEMTEHARNMVRAVSIPVIGDADTGYGGPANIHRTVREYIQAGVAAIHLEDQVAPKRCGQMAGIRLMNAEENARRLDAAVQSKGDEDLLIIARTDALAADGIEEAIRRALLYRRCGVDLLFVDGVKTIEQVRTISENVPGPKVISLVDGTEAANLSVRDLEELNFSIVFYALTALLSATHAVQAALSSLKQQGSIKNITNRHSYAEFKRLGEESGRVFLVDPVRDHRGNATRSRGSAVGLAGIAFVAQRGAWGDVRPDVGQGLETGCVGNLAAGQVERDVVARIVHLGVDFGREAAARASQRLALLPPFAPAAKTWARTMVETNTWIKWADPLIAANVSKKASNTPALLSRSNRFHSEFQWPKRSGRGRQRASRNNRSSAALRPRLSGLVAKHAELTALREKYKAEIKKLTVDIDHLDATIWLFDPNADTSPIKKYVTKHRA